MERWKVWFTEGLLAACILLLGILVLMAFLVRWKSLPNLAELLPAEHTAAYLVVNRKEFQKSLIALNPSTTATLLWQHLPVLGGELLGQSSANLEWLDRDLGFALVDGEWLTFLEVRSQRAAQNFLDQLKAEGEEYEKVGDEIQCYTVNHPYCFTTAKNFLVLSYYAEPLLKLHDASTREQSLENDPDHQNLRGRLPYLRSAFFYSNLAQSQNELIRWADRLNLREPAFLSALFQIFPVFGASIKMENQAWYIESFTAVDKEVLGGAYDHPVEKYPQKLLPWTEAFAFEWGTQNLSKQIQTLAAHMEMLHSTTRLLFESELETWLEPWLGPIRLEENIYPLLSNESYLGWSPGNAFLILLELPDEESKKPIEDLKNAFSTNYRPKEIYLQSNGEARAEMQNLHETQEQYEGVEVMHYTTSPPEEREILSLAFHEQTLILASNIELLKHTIDRMNGLNERPRHSFSGLLPGSDEITIFHDAFFSESAILKTLWTPFTEIVSTRKRFDDGVYTRTTLLK